MKYLLVLIILLIVPSVYAVDFGNNTFGSGCFGKDCGVISESTGGQGVGGTIVRSDGRLNETAKSNISEKTEEKIEIEKDDLSPKIWIFIILFLLLTVIAEIIKKNRYRISKFLHIK